MARMLDGEAVLRDLVAKTATGEWVGSVSSICAATDLSTGAGIAVMHKLIDEGLVRSTRGPKGGYWRTDKPMTTTSDDIHTELTAIAAELSRLSGRVEALVRQLK